MGLLIEWLEWWATDDDAPAKMPDALHVRTVTALIQNGVDVGGLKLSRDV